MRNFLQRKRNELKMQIYTNNVRKHVESPWIFLSIKIKKKCISF